MPTNAINAEPSEQPILLMKLPAEVHLIIYKFAFQDTVNYIISNTNAKAYRPKFRGTLALLHTSKSLRAESRDEFLGLATAQRERALAALRLRRSERAEAERSGSWDLRTEKFREQMNAACVVLAVDLLYTTVLSCWF